MDFHIVPIDGGAGTGTSSLVKGLSAWVGWPGLNTGHMYRSVALVAERRRISINDKAGLVRIAREIKFTYGNGNVVAINGEPVAESELSRMTGLVEDISGIKELREHIRKKQRNFAQGRNCFAEGRDLGTVVWPGAPLKIFLTCDPEIRAIRRSNKEGREVTAADIIRRDRKDAERDDCPMVPADDAITLDTTEIPEPRLVNTVEDLMRGIPSLRAAIRASLET